MSERLQVFGPGDILAISASAAARIASAGGKFSREELAVAFPQAAASRSATAKVEGPRVGIINILGVVFSRFDWWGLATSAESVRQQARALSASKDVDSIVLRVDSPGGVAMGIEEAADAIREARTKKPVVASIIGTSASAAYWMTAQASYVAVTPSGEAGSIGIYALHVDLSRALDQEGVTVTLIASDPEKIEGSPYEPLSDPARKTLEKQVGVYAAMFENSVAQGRRVSRSDVRERGGRGRVFQAQEARARGLVDTIATFEEVMAMAEAPAKIRAAIEAPERARAELLRAELELEYLRLGLEPPKNLGAPGPTPAEQREIEGARRLLLQP